MRETRSLAILVACQLDTHKTVWGSYVEGVLAKNKLFIDDGVNSFRLNLQWKSSYLIVHRQARVAWKGKSFMSRQLTAGMKSFDSLLACLCNIDCAFPPKENQNCFVHATLFSFSLPFAVKYRTDMHFHNLQSRKTLTLISFTARVWDSSEVRTFIIRFKLQ